MRAMSLKDVDIGAAMQRLADRKIEAAMAEGKFDNLKGMGQPLDLEPMPADENARMMWWALRLLKQNDVTPDEIRLRKQIERLRDELPKATTEARVGVLVTGINRLVKELNTLGTTALDRIPVAPASLEHELARLREQQAADGRRARARLAETSPAVRACPQPQCRTENAGAAQYCRRCGAPMGQ